MTSTRRGSFAKKDNGKVEIQEKASESRASHYSKALPASIFATQTEYPTKILGYADYAMNTADSKGKSEGKTSEYFMKSIQVGTN